MFLKQMRSNVVRFEMNFSQREGQEYKKYLGRGSRCPTVPICKFCRTGFEKSSRSQQDFPAVMIGSLRSLSFPVVEEREPKRETDHQGQTSGS